VKPLDQCCVDWPATDPQEGVLDVALQNERSGDSKGGATWNRKADADEPAEGDSMRVLMPIT